MLIIRCYVSCRALPLLHHRNTPSVRVYWEFPIPVTVCSIYDLSAYLPHPTTMPSEERRSAAIGARADSPFSFTVDKDPLQVGWWSEWGMGGACGEITRPLCAASTDEDSSTFFRGGVEGRSRSTAEDHPDTRRCRLRQQDNF